MTQLNDIIEINDMGTPAAIVVGQSLSNHNLVDRFAPTKATVTILAHLQKAVFPEATQENRALNIYGSYGSGKSHVAVVIAQLLRDGCGDSEFEHLFERLRNFGEGSLAKELKNTFLAADDANAQPYLLVSLYGSGTTSLGAKLIEGLYDALDRHPNLNPAEILPTTEYEVCIKRFEAIVSRSPELAQADLSQWQMAEHFLTTEDMAEGLNNHQALALELFKRWHIAVCQDAPFNPANEGGSNFINAYFEAGKNLAQRHSFGGIVVVWDEFGLALEDLISNPYRNLVTEIFELQEFVEKVCSPARGHTLFMGLTHKSFPQYASGCDESVRNRLETIFGRFRSFKIELSAAESEGYHLLGMQRSWTEFGTQQWKHSIANQEQLVATCSPLPLFKNLGQQLLTVSGEIYPLHPVMAAGLFALSALAQANRTALTFFRVNRAKILNKTVNQQSLFGQELIRLPELVEYYGETLEDKKAHELERYQRARNRIPAELSADESQGRLDILKLLLLSELLGENFQTNEIFLACALYDTQPTNSSAERLHTDLAWLKAEELIWKSDLTHQWTLLGDSGVNVEGLIDEKLRYFNGRSPETLLNENPVMREDLFPVLGTHELEPSPCGIVRAYNVELLTPPITNNLKLANPLLSGQVFLVLAQDAEEVAHVKARIQETSFSNIYFWVPTEGIRSESVSYNSNDFKLGSLLCRYLALKLLLKEKTASDDLRRQLSTKWEKTRKDLLHILQVLYGREGLISGKSEILQAGTAQAIACKSWYEFRSILTTQTQDLYSKEIPIRAMNMNKLNDESYARSSKVRKIVEHIINFEENPTYQANDLLGEDKDTSETSGLIDGVLGANHLFIQRQPDKWDIKKVDETDGAVEVVLTLLHKALLQPRDKAYAVTELRDKLIAPPYGIPACNLAILAAVAVRHKVKNLRWGSAGNESDFSTNLTNAFIAGSKLTIRVIEFTAKQFAMLYTVGLHFKMRKGEYQSQEEFGGECAAKLREFVKNQTDAVKLSNQLQDKPKELVKFLQAVPTKNAQDFADFLLNLFGLEHRAHIDISELAQPLLKLLLDDFDRIGDINRHEIKQTLQQVCPQNIEEKAQLVARLNNDQATAQAKAVGQLLEQHDDVADIDIKKITEIILNKSFDQCTDIEIGKCKGKLESLIEHYQQPVQTYYPKIEATLINSKEILISELNTYIQLANLTKQEIREVLQSILLKYGD